MNLPSPRVSFIIPTFNREEFLPIVLESLLEQLGSNHEIVVIDDGSTDNTEAVVQRYIAENVRYVRISNSERGAARNFGAKLSRGDYLNFFDSDDYALPNHVSVAENFICTKENPDWFHLNFAFLRDGKLTSAPAFSGFQSLEIAFFDGNCFSCNGVFIKRNFFLNNLFSEHRELSGSEDYELWLRLYWKSKPLFSNAVTSVVVDHQNRSVKRGVDERFFLRIQSLVRAVDLIKTNTPGDHLKIRRINSGIYSYGSLHTSDCATTKFSAMMYLVFSFIQCPSVVFNRRILVVIRNLLFRW